MQKDVEVRKQELLPIRSTPTAVVPRNSCWTVDFKGVVKLLSIDGRLISTGVKIGRRAVKF